MPKHEPMSAKAIGKQIKSKGLQKLKFFCQMCQKQCRDANGFKCHLTSEAHQRQLLLFAENPGRYLADFSGEFLKDFLHLLKRRYNTKRVYANQVYQEYIKDRNHLHMNSTRWSTLTGFCKWMGRMGICHVDHTEKGWFITWIDRDPETLLKKDQLAKKDKMAKDDEERQAKLIEDMIERGKRAEEARKDSSDDEEEDPELLEERRMLKKESDDQKITFSLAPKKSIDAKPIALNFLNKSLASSSSKSKLLPLVKKEEPFDEDHQEVELVVDDPNKPSTSKAAASATVTLGSMPEPKQVEVKKEESKDASLKRKLLGFGSSGLLLKSQPKKKKSALDEIIEEQERWKERKSEKSSRASKPETWLVEGIVVRVVTKDLGKEYYNKKATVERLVDDYGAIVRIQQGPASFSQQDLIKVDERHLETVVPKEGARVMVLRGMYRGRRATIASIDLDREKVKVAVDQASIGGRTVEMSFDDVSKIA